MDISSITAALQGIKTATDIAKAIKDSDLSLEKAELKLQIASLVEALADAKLNIVEIRKLLDEKEQEIVKLKQRKKMIFDGDVYWLPINEKEKEGPFCPKCLDTNNNLVRLHKDGPGWWCYTCEIHFGPSKWGRSQSQS